MSDNHLTDLLIDLAKEDVKFIICGGVAAVLHGVERMTLDLDIAIDFETANIQKFLSVIKQTHLVPRAPIPGETLLDPAKIKLLIQEKNARVFTFTDEEKPWRQIDVFITEDHAYNHILSDTVSMIIGGYKMLVVTKERLIQMKRAITPIREKDIHDIQILIRLQEKYE
jgi:hypothetical protein